MKKASQYFSPEQKKTIEAAVSDAEKNTFGEIVPVVATMSGRYDRAEDTFGIIFALICLSLAWTYWRQIVSVGNDWCNGLESNLSLLAVIGIFVIGLMLGTLLATIFPLLCLPFIPKKEMRQEVERSAAEAFQKYRVRGTKGATGILIYVSLYEHRVVVLGDSAIRDKLAPEVWNDICQAAIQSIKRRALAEGLIDAIRLSGKLLAEHFPVMQGDRNELGNELRLIDRQPFEYPRG
jgi:putative membrane protein